MPSHLGIHPLSDVEESAYFPDVMTDVGDDIRGPSTEFHGLDGIAVGVHQGKAGPYGFRFYWIGEPEQPFFLVPDLACLQVPTVVVELLHLGIAGGTERYRERRLHEKVVVDVLLQ